MTDEYAAQAADATYARAPDAAGAALRAAREAAGLSIDTVAQHLKLAPRQVRALENGDHGELPGRTFVRGFARNYARLLRLDPEAVVAALPDTAPHTSPLDGPTLSHAIGEMPSSEPPRRRASQWLIPLLLVALIAVAAYYELTRSKQAPRPPAARGVIPSAPADPIGPPGQAGTPLPNPLVASDAKAPSEPQSSPPVTAAPTEAPPAASSATLPITTAPSAEPKQGATLAIAYRAPAWTEVRDAQGERILLVTGSAGDTHTISGTPPFDLTLGNASATSVTWRGAPFDLAPHTRANVARVRLP